MLGSIIGSAVSMVAGKLIADKMSKKVLKQQTGFETTEEMIADANARAAEAQARAEEQARLQLESQIKAGTQAHPTAGAVYAAQAPADPGQTENK